MKLLNHLLVGLCTLLLAACGAGPDSDSLRKDVEARLAQALPPGTVSMVSFTRLGSQKDAKAPSGETRRIVYFDAELKLERAYDFGAWDSPGVAGLVSAMGGGPRGLVGIESGGNQAGDVVRAHGTALYKREGDGWVAVTAGGFKPAEAPTIATNAPTRGPAAMLDALRKVIDSAPKDLSPMQTAVIEEELANAHASIRSRLARASDGYAIAAGPEHGQYLRFARALGEGKPGRTIALVTRGGEENIELLRAGSVPLALAQGDAAQAAYEGSGVFSERGAFSALRAIGSLYPEPVHVLAREDLVATTAADLKGKRIAIGLPGSASRTTALRVLEAHGIALADFKPVELSLGEALVALQQKQVDAVIQVIGVPADSVRDAMAAVPLRLLSMTPAAVDKLVAGKTGLFAHSVAHGSYANQRFDVRTVATAAVLLAGTDLSDAEVAAITRTVFTAGSDFTSRGSAQGTQVSAANAKLGLTVPVHIAAGRVLDAASGAATPAAPAASR